MGPKGTAAVCLRANLGNRGLDPTQLQMRNFPCKGSFFPPPPPLEEARCGVDREGEVATWSVPGATGLPNPETPTALGCCRVLALWRNKLGQGPVGGQSRQN